MMLTLGLFIEYLATEPWFFFSVVVTVIVSITLHELAHGCVAILLGDDTPRVQNRLTLDPLVHMGHWSIAMMLIAGFAWGSMPVNPGKLRGRHGDALVSVAGPACNVLLALIGLTALGLWIRWGGYDTSAAVETWRDFLWYFGYINIGLAIFNMIPVPPLDGSRVLASFSSDYRDWMYNVSDTGMPLLIVLGAVILLGQAGYGLWDLSSELAGRYMELFLPGG